MFEFKENHLSKNQGSIESQCADQNLTSMEDDILGNEKESDRRDKRKYTSDMSKSEDNKPSVPNCIFVL